MSHIYSTSEYDLTTSTVKCVSVSHPRKNLSTELPQGNVLVSSEVNPMFTTFKRKPKVDNASARVNHRFITLG